LRVEGDEIWLHAEVDGKLSAFVTTPWISRGPIHVFITNQVAR
jgi:hypothetical protein